MGTPGFVAYFQGFPTGRQAQLTPPCRQPGMKQAEIPPFVGGERSRGGRGGVFFASLSEGWCTRLCACIATERT